MRKALVAYVPVIHSGYISLFERHWDRISEAWIMGSELIEELRDPVAEIRQLNPEMAAKLVRCTNVFKHGFSVDVLTPARAKELSGVSVVTMDDIVCRRFAERYLKGNDIQFDTAFLRWDSSNVKSSSTVAYDRKVPFAEVSGYAREALAEGKKTTSWWREVGAVAFRDGQVLGCEHNTHMPDEHSVFMEGDPRDSIETGTDPGMSSAIHAEAKLVARLGRPILEGASVLLTTFPCVPCAQLLCLAGLKQLYYMSGNAYLHVDQVLKAHGMEIIYVEEPEWTQ